MNEDVYLNLISRYVSNDLSLEETEVLLEWLGNNQDREDLLRDFQETWDLTKNYPENFRVDTFAAWMRLRTTIKDVEPQKNVSSIPVLKWVGIVAAFVFLVVVLIIGLKYWLAF